MKRSFSHLAIRHLGGGGPRLLLIHGLASGNGFWNTFATRLRDRFTIAAVDLPGHGTSPPITTVDAGHPRALAAAVAMALDDIGWEQPHVAGLSLGGWVAVELAAADKVASVTAFAPAGLWRRPPSPWGLRCEYALTAVLRAAGSHRHKIVRIPGIVPAIVRAQLRYPERMGAEEICQEIDAMAAATGYWKIATHLCRDRFQGGAAITVPVGVVFGANDRLLGPMSRQDPTLLPRHAEIIELADCNHGVIIDQPEQALAMLQRTVERATPHSPAVQA